MYFDFEENHPDIPHVPHALTWRDAAYLSIIIHLLVVVAILVLPPLDRRAALQRIEQQIALQRQRDREAPRFVFVQPHLDMPATRPLSPRSEASDKDRNAQTRERAPNPTNSLPFSRGNTPERVEAGRPTPPPPQSRPETPPEGPNGQSSSEAGSPPPNPNSTGPTISNNARAGTGKVPNAPGETGSGAGSGLLASAMRDLQQYIRSEAFDNRGGGGNNPYGQAIQFDTKGVEFGPWLRRFIAQIKRNWFIPYAAMSLKGHVVITFNIHKDGRITDLSVPGPCNVDAFNRSAFNALSASNPTYPLPPEYPSEKAFFTVTFFYNETPPGGGY
jgi:TonB family protein